MLQTGRAGQLAANPVSLWPRSSSLQRGALPADARGLDMAQDCLRLGARRALLHWTGATGSSTSCGGQSRVMAPRVAAGQKGGSAGRMQTRPEGAPPSWPQTGSRGRPEEGPLFGRCHLARRRERWPLLASNSIWSGRSVAAAKIISVPLGQLRARRAQSSGRSSAVQCSAVQCAREKAC